jgi:hypothetical protein
MAGDVRLAGRSRIEGGVVSTTATDCDALFALNPFESVTRRKIEWIPGARVTVASAVAAN